MIKLSYHMVKYFPNLFN